MQGDPKSKYQVFFIITASNIYRFQNSFNGTVSSEFIKWFKDISPLFQTLLGRPLGELIFVFNRPTKFV